MKRNRPEKNQTLFSCKLSSSPPPRILDSLVVRISACHVEGRGSIPRRGVHFFVFETYCQGTYKQVSCFDLRSYCNLRAQVAQSVER